MAKTQGEKYWFELFEIGIALKALNGLFELVTGSLVLFVSKDYFSSLFFRFARGELLEDPNDKVIGFLARSLENLSPSTKLFAAGYILAHGIMNLFLAIQLFRQKAWAYILTIFAMLVFIVYQLYRISHSYSIVLSLITVWDIIFIGVVWHEYKNKNKLR